MKREQIHTAAELEKTLARLERDRWVFANLQSVTFQLKNAKDFGPHSAGQDDGGIPADWWTLRMEIDLPAESMAPVRDALIRVYDDAIKKTKEKLRELGVDPEDDL